MRITFTLEGWTTRPVGGYKIVYEYANRLAKRGHTVNVVCPIDITNERGFFWRGYIRARRRIATWVRHPWFQFDGPVNFMVPPTLEEKFLPDADCVIASDWPTAYRVNGFSRRKGDKFYFVQGYETWLENRQHIDATFKLNLKKIVISTWLRQQMAGFGETSSLVPNAIDAAVYQTVTPIESRNGNAIGMLYHTEPFKGFDQGLQAAAMVKERHPKLTLQLFGVYPKPSNLPVWASYVRRPAVRELVKLYNNLSIFVHTSEIEGWALTPFEAMACGCATAATNSRGILDYAEEGVTALISPPRDPQALAQNILRLIKDDALRISLAKSGQGRVKQFTWDRSVSAFERVLNNRP